MIGLNGGLVGKPRSAYVNSGIWTPNEQRLSLFDPYWKNVSLLLHMNGSNGSTSFNDSSPNSFVATANGDAKISTAQSKFGAASGLYDGAGDYLSISNNSALDFGIGDFTIESWIFPSSISGSHAIAAKWDYQNDNWLLRIESATELKFWHVGGSVSVTTSIATGQWSHVAVTRAGGSLRFFVNGTQAGATSSVTTSLTNNSSCTVGAYLGPSGVGTIGSYFNGYIDELRITKGVARYIASFTAPAAPFPDA